jgi:hypothetical protein
VALLFARLVGGPRLARFEVAILLTALAVWAFNNLAPPYAGKWQMRGEWIARLYQPLFPVLLTYLARLVEPSGSAPTRARRWLTAGVAGTVVLNALVMTGPFLGATGYTGTVYAAFYAHAPPGSDYGRDPVGTMEKHLELLGRRPLGVCSPPGGW